MKARIPDNTDNYTYHPTECEEAIRRNRLLLRYIRDKINQLLLVMGTKPLKDTEISDEGIIAFDPIGIITESFAQILEHLKGTIRQLQIARDHLQAVFDTAGVGISIVDPDLRIIKCNEKQKELLVSKDTSEIEGRHCYEVYCGIDSPPMACPAIETLETGRAVFLKEVTKKGRVFQIVTSPLKNSSGNIMGVIEVSLDITEKKKAENAMRQSEKLASIGQLAAGIAHELNNPLGNILGYTKLLLQDNSLSEEQRAKLEIIAEQAHVGSKIIRGLLDFSHQQKPVFEKISINATIEKVIKSIMEDNKIKSSNIKIIKNLGDLPPLLADPNQMEQVVHNIILNAVHALEGRDNGFIEIKTMSLNNTVEFSVKDNGTGISKEHLGRIFDPFFTTKPVGKGTGLGLSICTGIVHEHGGTIHVESEIGKGTTFIVRIPNKPKTICK